MAIVAESPWVFGLGRVYEAYYGDGPWVIRVFYELEKAEKWVNLSDQIGNRLD